MKTLGADIIRLWVAATDYRSEMSVSDEILKRTADAYRRIRNTTRFLLANLNGFDPAINLVAPEDMIELDRWAVDRALRLQEEIVEAYRSYQFHLIYQKVHNFCVVDLGGVLSGRHQDRHTAPRRTGSRGAPADPPSTISPRPWCAGRPRCSPFTADEVWGFIAGTEVRPRSRRPGTRGSSRSRTDDRFDRATWDRYWRSAWP